MAVEVIYGVNVFVPDSPPESVKVFKRSDDPKEQYWERIELPDFFEFVTYNKDGDLLLTEEQETYAREEKRRCFDGFWFYKKGIPTYITGKQYFYLQWWKLEDDIYPDYRETCRKYFLYLNHWEHIMWCLGISRGKKRREGASSEACSNLMYECIFYTNSKCGLISKSKDDSRDTFTDMVAFGYKKLPVFFQPKQLNSKDSVTELVFAQKSGIAKDGVAKTVENTKGNQSRVNYRAPVLNAYDRGKMSRVLLDEFGKLDKDVPASKLFSIISETLVKGVKRVGFVEMPSTINELTKHGGAEYKIIWENAKKLKKNGRVTVNRLVTYFSPAYEGLEGFIDKYGDSVIDSPDEETYEWLVNKWIRYDDNTGDLVSEISEDDIRLGAKEYLLTTREGLIGDLLEEQVRKYPFDEEEMFMYAGIGCEFNSANINHQIKWIEDNPEQCYWRQMRLGIKTEKIKSNIPNKKEQEKITVYPMDDNKGGWFILEYPNKENLFTNRGGYIEPDNKLSYQIGVDTTQDRIAIAGSNPAICVLKKSCIIDGIETGLYPVALWISPTRLDIHFDEEVKKACLWYGCQANYEIDRRTDFYRYFSKENCQALLTWTPTIMKNPLKPNKAPEFGSRSGDPFQLAQMLQISKWYMDGDSQVEYNGHVHRIKHVGLLKEALHYDHLLRTKSDLFVSMQMALVAVFGEMQMSKKNTEEKPMRLLPTYKIKMVS